MQGQALKATHPILIVAGIAVTIFSLAGIAAIMGWIPTSKSEQAAATAPLAQLEQPKAAPEPAKETRAAPAPAHTAKPHAPAHKPVQVARAEPQVAQVPPPPPARVICRECGVIGGIHEIEKAGEGSGGGAVAGGIVGGVAGHQMGSGRGNTVMTVLGAVGGAVAGNAIEKKAKTTHEWEILVNLEDGSSRVVKSATAPAWRVGDKVKVVDGVIQSNG